LQLLSGIDGFEKLNEQGEIIWLRRRKKKCYMLRDNWLTGIRNEEKIKE
jgi:hypothetical protein